LFDHDNATRSRVEQVDEFAFRFRLNQDGLAARLMPLADDPDRFALKLRAVDSAGWELAIHPVMFDVACLYPIVADRFIR
jgi:hypothetical protein